MGNGWRRRAERRLHRGRQAEFQRRSAGFHRVRVGHLPGAVLPHESLDAAKALGAPIGLLSPAESCLPLVPCGPLCTACSRWARQVRLIQVSGRHGTMPRPRGRKALGPAEWTGAHRPLGPSRLRAQSREQVGQMCFGSMVWISVVCTCDIPSRWDWPQAPTPKSREDATAMCLAHLLLRLAGVTRLVPPACFVAQECTRAAKGVNSWIPLEGGSCNAWEKSLGSKAQSPVGARGEVQKVQILSVQIKAQLNAEPPFYKSGLLRDSLYAMS